MSVLEILYFYCAALMPCTEAVSQCMVELHECTYQERKENPNATFAALAAICNAKKGDAKSSGGSK